MTESNRSGGREGSIYSGDYGSSVDKWKLKNLTKDPDLFQHKNSLKNKLEGKAKVKKMVECSDLAGSLPICKVKILVIIECKWFLKISLS